MKFWAALAGGLLSVQLCLCTGIFNTFDGLFPQEGRSFITQAGTVAGSAGANREYDIAFGKNWESVRIFRLLQPLQAPLKVYIETNPAKNPLYKAQYKDYVVQSLNTWANALDGRLSYTLTSNPRQADITVNWVTGFTDKYIAGITTYRVGHAAIDIKTIGVPEKDIKGNILHEVGHALGISGHSDHPGDIMVGVRRWQRGNTAYEPKLSARDVQAIRRLYSAQWEKGEDLYTAKAQTAPITSPANGSTIAGGASDTASLVLNLPQAPQQQPAPEDGFTRVYTGKP